MAAADERKRTKYLEKKGNFTLDYDDWEDTDELLHRRALML
jgi:hypothetical protein